MFSFLIYSIAHIQFINFSFCREFIPLKDPNCETTVKLLS